MRERKGGVILNFGSISWHLGLPDLTLYMTAKAGIEGMTHGMARDFGRDGVRVNAIIPGAIRTPRQTLLWHTPKKRRKSWLRNACRSVSIRMMSRPWRCSCPPTAAPNAPAANTTSMPAGWARNLSTRLSAQRNP
jgi:NAD(P)-dependent dehydrogenase (short-subunit alcohol dehydrogenase family)